MNKFTHRSDWPALALMFAAFSWPFPARSEQPVEYQVAQHDTGVVVLRLPRSIRYVAKQSGSRSGGHAARRRRDEGIGRRQDDIKDLPDALARGPLSVHSGEHPTVVQPAGQTQLLPGLPGALVAVVEGSPIEASSSSPESVPSRARQRVTSSAVSVPSLPSGPVSLTATAMDDPDPALRGLFLPFETVVGAAAFSRDDDVIVVFDAARPFDLSTIQDDQLGAGSTIQLLPDATLLHLRKSHAADIALRRLPAGWLIQAHGSSQLAKIITPSVENGVLHLPVADAGRSVVVPDPQTGGNLLVGTIRSGRDAVRSRRRGSTEILERTIQGVVVDPLSDRLELRPVTGAFLLSGPGLEALGSNDVASKSDAGGTVAVPRILSMTPGSPELLYRRFREARAAAAAAPPEARYAPRLVAAEDALALNDYEEAATIAHVAVADDAREVASLRPRLIIAAAALLHHQPEGVDLLDDPHLSSNGEGGLWRAVKLAERNSTSPEAARLFAASLPLLKSYPAPLQAFLLPLAGESLVRGGNDAQAALAGQLPAEPSLRFVRALLAERRGQRQVALDDLDRLAADPEIPLADMAVEEGVAIRRRLPASNPKKLADILEGHLLDARISGHEVASRFQLAELRAQAGQWLTALDLLEETATLYPEQQTETRRRIGQVLTRMTSSPLRLGDEEALKQAAVIEAYAGMLPEGADGSRISLFLADRLGALGLPERAAPIVRKLLDAAAPGLDRAELGLKLADLDFQQNDLAGVQAALRDSDPGDLPPGVTAARLIMMARSLAAAGQLDQALATISTLDTDEALDLKANLSGRRGDWSGTSDALLTLARRYRPTNGKLDVSGQDLLLRLASAASRSQDKERIEQVLSLGSGRFADPGKEALFHLLVSDVAAKDTDPAKILSEVTMLRHNPAIFEPIAK